LKWVLESHDEEHRDAALRVRQAWLAGQCQIILPSLWFFEVGNILGVKQPKLAASLMRILTAYGFDEASPAGIHEETFRLMKAYKVTFYDAVYHAVAIKHAGVMITADDIYYRKTLRRGHVTLLTRWQATGPAGTPSAN
jgi:predicted nucleic acid-binding protein